MEFVPLALGKSMGGTAVRFIPFWAWCLGQGCITYPSAFERTLVVVMITEFALMGALILIGLIRDDIRYTRAMNKLPQWDQ